MSSLVIYANKDLQDIDAEALDVITGSAAPLTDGTVYHVQNTGLQANEQLVGRHHYACLVQVATEPDTADKIKRARAGAVLLLPFGEGARYEPKAGKTGYVWSPYGEVSVSINPSPQDSG